MSCSMGMFNQKMQKSEEIQIGILNKVSDFLTSEDYFMEL